MRTKSAFASILVFVAGLGTAVAQQPPMENKGLKVEPLSGYALGKQGLDDFAQRQFRIRQLTLEPGGVAGFHSHKERPAFTYVMKGSLTEHRKGGGPDRIYKPGEVLVETTDVEHWAENTTAEPVVLISADLFKGINGQSLLNSSGGTAGNFRRSPAAPITLQPARYSVGGHRV